MVPGVYATRVFIGGVEQDLPTLRVIESIVTRKGCTPILAFDYKIPREETYRACIKLLLECSKAVFEVSESGGQVYEIPKAFEFGVNPMLVARSEPTFQGVSMLRTLCMQHRAKIVTYCDYEDLDLKISSYLNNNRPARSE